MARDSVIKWRKGDLISLGKVVSNFNKEVNKLENLNNELYLPELRDYKEIKNKITTRKELNRIINSLKSFSEDTSDIITLESGQKITKWEYGELKAQRRIAQRRLKKELAQFETPNEQGFTRVQMGSERYKEIKRQIENLNDLEKRKGYEFNMMKNRISYMGTEDYKMRKAIVYRQNYMKNLENKYKDFENYEVLKNKLDRIQNPLRFYDYTSSINENVADMSYQSDQYYTQQEFNKFVESFGIEITNETLGNLDEMRLL